MDETGAEDGSDAASMPMVRAAEALARVHGATPQGVGWPNAPDLVRRFDVMLDIVRDGGRFSLLDIGCGPGLILDYLQARGWADRVDYHGTDVSRLMLDLARRDWPEKCFELRDILQEPFPEASFDYVILSGIFNSRLSLTYPQMEAFLHAMTETAWRSARRAMAWNVTSKHVDWERDDLFHLPMDSAAAHCKARLSRHVAIRADYGLWEYTVQVFRQPLEGTIPVPPRWRRDAAPPAGG